MFVVNSVSKITRDYDGVALIIECRVTNTLIDETFGTTYGYREDDPYGLSPVLKQWLGDNPNFPIDPYVPPVAPTPEEARKRMSALTARQFRLGLVAGGYAPAQVTRAIDTMPDGTAKETAKIEWEYATTFNRIHPLIAIVGTALGMNDTQIDAMWLAAVNL